jgi:hypothetical protein
MNQYCAEKIKIHINNIGGDVYYFGWALLRGRGQDTASRRTANSPAKKPYFIKKIYVDAEELNAFH